MAKGRTPTYRVAGLEPLGGKSRRWRDVSTGETISYNAGRARVVSFSASHRTKTARFERELVQTKDVDAARKKSGLSKRGLDAYRKVSSAKQGWALAHSSRIEAAGDLTRAASSAHTHSLISRAT
jgi:hypothetical protein